MDDGDEDEEVDDADDDGRRRCLRGAVSMVMLQQVLIDMLKISYNQKRRRS